MSIYMPFELKKVKDGYYVENKTTKKKYSNKPLPLKNAKGQMRILQRIERMEKK
tara:strand:+ start:252 stop:413 length:162 start_codon:yes stop_codon:yes gene_type:complete